MRKRKRKGPFVIVKGVEMYNFLLEFAINDVASEHGEYRRTVARDYRHGTSPYYDEVAEQALAYYQSFRRWVPESSQAETPMKEEDS